MTSLASPSRETRVGATRLRPDIRQIEYGIAEERHPKPLRPLAQLRTAVRKELHGHQEVCLLRMADQHDHRLAEWQAIHHYQWRRRCRSTQSKQMAICTAITIVRFRKTVVVTIAQTRSAIARLGHKTLTEFFNTAAFAPQPLGTIGNTQRNSLFGPDFRHVDLSIFKNFPDHGTSWDSVPRGVLQHLQHAELLSSRTATAETRPLATQPSVRSRQPIRTTPHGSISSPSKCCSNLNQHNQPAAKRNLTSPPVRFALALKKNLKTCHIFQL